MSYSKFYSSSDLKFETFYYCRMYSVSGGQIFSKFYESETVPAAADGMAFSQIL
jgi:hypothetical protein